MSTSVRGKCPKCSILDPLLVPLAHVFYNALKALVRCNENLSHSIHFSIVVHFMIILCMLFFIGELQSQSDHEDQQSDKVLNSNGTSCNAVPYDVSEGE